MRYLNSTHMKEYKPSLLEQKKLGICQKHFGEEFWLAEILPFGDGSARKCIGDIIENKMMHIASRYAG